MKDDLKVSIISPPDREYLAVEIIFNDEQWAELNQEGGTLSLEIYPRRDGQPWQLSYESVMAALKKAKERLPGEMP